MNKKHIIVYLSMFFFLITFFFSCSDKNVYKSNVPIPSEKWSSKNAAIFEPTILDTNQVFNINLNISNSNEYRYQNIWLFIRSVSPAGYAHLDTAEFFLAEDDGKWLGKKSNDIYSLDIKFKQKIRFPKSGKYSFEIFQGMRDLELKGIHSVGFEVEKAD